MKIGKELPLHSAAALPGLLLSCVLACSSQPPQPAAPGQPLPARRALMGATLVDGTGAAPVPDSVVVIDGPRIACAGTRAECPVPDGTEVLDLTGHWITPGIVDAHVHFSQTGWTDGRPDFFDVRDQYPYEQVQADLRAHPQRFFDAYLCSGVTAVFDVGGYPWTWDIRDNATDPRAPHVAAAGPLITHSTHRLTRIHPPAEMQFIALTDPEAGRAAVRYLHANRTDAVKIWFLTPEPGAEADIDARVQAVGDEAKKLGVPLVVHATYLRLAKVAVRAGARVLVHDVRDPVDDEFIALLKETGTVYTPTVVVSYGYQRVREAAVTGVEPPVDDPHGCVDANMRARISASTTLADDLPPPPEGKTHEQDVAEGRAALDEAHRVMYDNLRRIHAAGVTVAMGTDAGNPGTLHGPSVYAQMEAMQAAGLTPLDVLVASTHNGAIAMGRADQFGTVTAGKYADLLVLDADPTADIANMRKRSQVWRAGVAVVTDQRRAP